MSLSSLPTELQFTIISHLGFLDKHTLGLVSRRLRSLIPPPTLEELNKFQYSKGRFEYLEDCQGSGRWTHRGSPWAFCDSCKRLRLRTKFGVSDSKRVWNRYGQPFFCLECGLRPLPGENRFQLGEMWVQTEEAEKTVMIRCPMCCSDGPAIKARRKRFMTAGHKRVAEWERDECRKCYEQYQTFCR